MRLALEDNDFSNMAIGFCNNLAFTWPQQDNKCKGLGGLDVGTGCAIIVSG
jgi:hypothetical protein